VEVVRPMIVRPHLMRQIDCCVRKRSIVVGCVVDCWPSKLNRGDLSYSCISPFPDSTG